MKLKMKTRMRMKTRVEGEELERAGQARGGEVYDMKQDRLEVNVLGAGS